jgi:hypothetical protein
VLGPPELEPPLPPLAANETAAKATAVTAAATSERPNGPKRIVIALFFFIATPLGCLTGAIKPAGTERRLRAA